LTLSTAKKEKSELFYEASFSKRKHFLNNVLKYKMSRKEGEKNEKL
jgi:hypothetical protein